MEKTPERRRRLDVLTQAERSQRISANGGDGRPRNNSDEIPV
jgi:hypothetical protein